ncbi:MAG: adenylosuccinate lyase, partial [Oligoflexia bacterium]|nr:adenylosuccinate lyase [Oligoflexia bacterium]
MNNFSSIAISPIDGRYHNDLLELSSYFSEEALFKYRIIVEIKYFKYILNDIFNYHLNEEQSRILNNLMSDNDFYHEIKDIEDKTKHDVKAVEIFLRNKLTNIFPQNILNLIHFGLTSEDINNLSYNLLIKDYINTHHNPLLKDLLLNLRDLCLKYKLTVWPT